eukprot:scaffold15214_cov72-Cylindrotheca_fusiformis.AAC.2
MLWLDASPLHTSWVLRGKSGIEDQHLFFGAGPTSLLNERLGMASRSSYSQNAFLTTAPRPSR